MYAVIQTGGKQYKVVQDQVITIEKLSAQEGDSIQFEEVLMVADGNKVTLGQPLISGAKVTAEVLEQGRGKKIVVVKFRRRKHYMRRQGHRQHFTKVKITGISS
jgi:large subunit ribosomal protein L21